MSVVVAQKSCQLERTASDTGEQTKRKTTSTTTKLPSEQKQRKTKISENNRTQRENKTHKMSSEMHYYSVHYGWH